MTRSLTLVAVVAALMALSSAARADDPTLAGPLRWDPAWSHAGPADYALTVFGAADVAVYVPLLQPRQPPLVWTRPILFDDDVRNWLRASSPAARANAGLASWVLFGAVVAYPVLDVPYAWARYGRKVAWDLFWQDATALSLATAFDLNLRDVIGRARPPESACLTAGGSTITCLGTSSEATRSFPGGHVLIVTTAATLTCTQHLTLHLYGGPWDAVACGTAIAADAAVGTLRIVSDDHWASDILSGWALGVAFGWGIPVLMHLHGHSSDATDPGLHLAPVAIPVSHGGGAGVTGWF